MRFAIVQAGMVANIAEADEDFGVASGWIASDVAGIGDTWNGTVFTRPAPQAIVPAAVTMRQARRALRRANLLQAVDDAIAAIPDAAAREDARIDWERSQEVRRDWPLIAQLKPSLGLTDADVDELFILASTL